MTFLSRIAAGVVATSLVLSAPSAFALELRISSASPPVSPLISAFEIIKERMEAAYPGDITVSIHHSSSLFKQGTELPAMQRGNLEMATPNVYEIEQQLPEYGALGMPYIFRDVDHMLAVFRGEIGDQYIADVQAKKGIVILDTGYLGTRTVGMRTARNVKSPDDLAGIKLRMPPGAAYQNLATALGATPVSMPATEVYLALKTGAIDGQDNPLEHFERLEVQRGHRRVRPDQSRGPADLFGHLQLDLGQAQPRAAGHAQGGGPRRGRR